MRENKTEQFLIRMTSEDKELLKDKAGKACLTQSEYIRKLIRGEKVHEHSLKSIAQLNSLIHETNKIGVNINQIVHNLNMDKYSEYEKQKLFALMEKLYEKVNEVIMIYK